VPPLKPSLAEKTLEHQDPDLSDVNLRLAAMDMALSFVAGCEDVDPYDFIKIAQDIYMFLSSGRTTIH
jgi:hypothetical protein